MNWEKSRKGLAVLMILVFLAGCSTVPLTGRSQLNLISPPVLMQMSVDNYRQVLRKSKLSKNKKEAAMVRKVGDRIAKASELFLRQEGLEREIKNLSWEFNLIEDDKTINAWCMPGGKVAVYSGILPITKDETGLAVVIGHEVAHALAKHGNERLSQGLLAQMGGIALQVALSKKPAATQQLFLTAYGLGATVGVILPYSRQQEFEADRIGLTIMALAGYDPAAAVGFWERMNKADKGPRPPEFLSTHPAPKARIDQIKRFIPEAQQHYRKK